MRKLKEDHKHREFGKDNRHCAKCDKFNHIENYGDIEGISVDQCELYQPDGRLGGEIILATDYGVCDEFDNKGRS